MPTVPAPIRLAVVNDYEIVVAGVRTMLAARSEVLLVPLDPHVVRIDLVDIVLYDTFAQPWHDESHLEELVERSGARVVVFTWRFDAGAIARAYAAGAAGYLSKGLTAAGIVAALQQIHLGRRITSPPRRSEVLQGGAWPGQAQGLTARESEVLALITQGLSNEVIADAMCLSINSIKSHIRKGYRKIGVRNRAQAVRYGMQHGFEPHRTDTVT